MLKKLPSYFSISLLLLFSSFSSVLANGEHAHEEAATTTKTLDEALRMQSIQAVVVASIIILGAVAITILVKHLGETFKKILFLLIVIPTLTATVFLAGSTIYLNIVSISGGPVHWHAEYQVWDCGQQLELGDPEGISNRVGTSTLHEHNDGWIHLEGVVVEQSEASLGKYFDVIGGKITSDSLRFPTDSGLIVRHDGDRCPDGTEGNLQTFVYQTRDGVFTQKKIQDPASYLLSPFGSIPPGDCIIIEFGSDMKETTDKLCTQYELQLKKGTVQKQDTQEQTGEDGDHEHLEEKDHDHSEE